METPYAHITRITKPMKDKGLSQQIKGLREFVKEFQDRLDEMETEMFKRIPVKQEGDPKYIWAVSFSGDGYFIDSTNSKVIETTDRASQLINRCVFKTREQALSALAFAQLSHIVSKYNEPRPIGDYYWCIQYNVMENRLELAERVRGSEHLYFNVREDAEISLNTNYDLWKQYWML